MGRGHTQVRVAGFLRSRTAAEAHRRLGGFKLLFFRNDLRGCAWIPFSFEILPEGSGLCWKGLVFLLDWTDWTGVHSYLVRDQSQSHIRCITGSGFVGFGSATLVGPGNPTSLMAVGVLLYGTHRNHHGLIHAACQSTPHSHTVRSSPAKRYSIWFSFPGSRYVLQFHIAVNGILLVRDAKNRNCIRICGC